MSLGGAYLILLVAVAAVATLRWPLVGVCSMLLIDFLRPQDLHPELGAIRPVLWLAIATLAATLWRDRDQLGRTWKPLLPLAAVLAVAALSAATTDFEALAWGAWIALAKTVLVAVLVVVHLDSARRFEAALWIIAGSVAVLALAAIANGVAVGYPDAFRIVQGGIGGPPGRFSAQWPEGDGPMRDNNAFARVLVFSLPLYWVLWKLARGRGVRSLAVVAGLATLVALMLTFSRSGFVAAAAVLALAVLQIRPRWKAAAALVAMVVVGYAATPRIYHDRIRSVTLTDESLRLRYGIWEKGLEMAASRPVLGVGIGTFAAHYGRVAPPPPRSAHNVFVEVLAEMGVVGLAAYLWLLGAAFRRLRRVAASPEPSLDGWPARQVAGGLALALAGYLVSSSTLSHAFTSHLMAGLAIAFALTTWRSRLAAGAGSIASVPCPSAAAEGVRSSGTHGDALPGEAIG